MQRDSYTNKELMLNVGDGHKLFVVDWGNTKAKTKVIFLHGGPGSSVKDKYKAAFDPKIHHVIFLINEEQVGVHQLDRSKTTQRKILSKTFLKLRRSLSSTHFIFMALRGVRP